MNEIKFSLLLVFCALLVVAVVAEVILRPVKRYRRLYDAPFPDSYLKIIENNLVLWKYLPPELRWQLTGLVNVFLAEKSFEGCAGAETDDEIRVTVAAAACILLLGDKEPPCYPSLRNILIYPDSYVVPDPQMIGEHVVLEDDDVLDGSCCETGTVILGRKQVLEECRDYGGGGNVVWHEFAHQIDAERGLGERGYAALTADFMRCYERFGKAVKGGSPDVLDEYGAEDPAEFFAVSTEAFFDTPLELRHRHPDLYQLLKAYYRLDPASWL